MSRTKELGSRHYKKEDTPDHEVLEGGRTRKKSMDDDLDYLLFSLALRNALARWVLLPEEERTLYEFARILQQEMNDEHEIGEI